MSFTVNGQVKSFIYINDVEKSNLYINDKLVYANVKISINSSREWNATSSRPTRYHFWTDATIPFDCTVNTYLKKNNGNTEGNKTTTITSGQKLDVSWSTSRNYNVGDSGTGWYCIVTPTNASQWSCPMPGKITLNYYCTGSDTQKHNQTDNFIFSNFSITVP